RGAAFARVAERREPRREGSVRGGRIALTDAGDVREQPLYRFALAEPPASRRRALEQVVLEEPQQRVAEEPLFPVERRDFACELEQVLELRARSPTQCRHGDLDERQLQLRPQGVELAEQRAH